MAEANSRRLIPYSGLKDFFGIEITRTTAARMIADGRLPKPIRSSPTRSGRIYFWVDEVEAALRRWPSGVDRQAA